METKVQIMKELSKEFERFRNKETKMYDLFELAYYCYMQGRMDLLNKTKDGR